MKTGSGNFFLRALGDLGTVEAVYPTNASTLSLVLDRFSQEFYDLVVVWQLDFAAAPLLIRGQRVVIIPMVDGSAHVSKRYWRTLADGYFLSFSKQMNSYFLGLGFNSRHLQYYPEPLTYSVPTSDNAYYWYRPSGNLGLEKSLIQIDRLYSNYPRKKIWLRISSNDIPEPNLFPGHGQNPSTSLRNKKRFEVLPVEEREDHIEALRESDSFIAPRGAEGIGMTVLEALSTGRPVIARDYPTMNEYIRPEENGYLFQRFPVRPLPSELDFQALGLKAHNLCVEGRSRYLLSEAHTLNSIEQYAKKPRLASGAESVWKKSVHLAGLTIEGLVPRPQGLSSFDTQLKLRRALHYFEGL